MKRLVKAQTSVHEQLIQKLNEDLEGSFEDNILNKYGIYSDDPASELDGRSQEQIWMACKRARKDYIEAMADVIQHVDVYNISQDLW